MVYHAKSNLLSRIREGRVKDTSRELEARRDEIYRRMASHPWEFLKAKDIDGTPIIRTKNEKHKPGDPAFQGYPYEREYLYHMVHTLSDMDNFMIVMPKSRQIMASYTTLLVMWWRILFLEAQNILVSRTKKDGSVKIIKDKIRDTHAKLPTWMKLRCPITSEPKNMIEAINTGSTITGVPQTFARSESRGDSGTVVVDEAAHQGELPNIITAAIAMANQIALISSPKKVGPGSATMQLLIRRAKDNAISVIHPCEGLTITRAMVPESDKALVLFEAFVQTEEQKSKSWFYTTDATRRQEQEGSWDSSEGTPYFPEFSVYGGEPTYATSIEGLDPSLPIDRGLDFGVTRPACVWSQLNPRTNRVIVARAHLGADVDPWSYARLIRYLSGEIPLSALANHIPALRLLNELKGEAKEGRAAPPPWFGPGFMFRSWGGREIYDTITSGPGAKNTQYVEIFASEGIPIIAAGGPKERREYLCRQILKPRAEDMTPSLKIDSPGAKLLLDAFAWGLTRPLKVDAVRGEEPANDHYYKDIYDAFGYTLVGTMNHIDWNSVGLVEEAITPRDSTNVQREEVLRRLGVRRWGETGEGQAPPTLFEQMIATRW